MPAQLQKDNCGIRKALKSSKSVVLYQRHHVEETGFKLAALLCNQLLHHRVILTISSRLKSK